MEGKETVYRLGNGCQFLEIMCLLF